MPPHRTRPKTGCTWQHGNVEELLSPLHRLRSVLAVVAHPDDESFGLGAILDAFVVAGARSSLLCFTAGEGSTLHARPDLGRIRADELAAAARALGLSSVRLLDHPDGGLEHVALGVLVEEIHREATITGADGLLVFDAEGITGHPDHRRATEAALAAATTDRLPVLGWALPDRVAAQLNDEFGTAFRGRSRDEIDIVVDVARDRQFDAIARHRSQSVDNPVVWRRLELLDGLEHLRWLRRP